MCFCRRLKYLMLSLIYYKWGLLLENQFENKFSFLIIKFPFLFFQSFQHTVFTFYLNYLPLSSIVLCSVIFSYLYFSLLLTCYSFISCFSFSHTRVLLTPRENWHETIWWFLRHRLSCCRRKASRMYTSYDKNYIVINH